ncbi:spore coat protein [Oceanobacillus polygoni]|uniref:Spore coat protein X n=2 Tax=Oceanobacillus polygoni TaxID=1235259 RepID=A0A9X1CB51_9BACI|nr:spore coat protein [Oceanobacillus polygoni]MBP2076586.1 spore coat protein X [Oceanobacillus polygoni]
MAVYRSSRDMNNYTEVHHDCANNFSEKRKHESSNESRFDYNFYNNDDGTVSQDGGEYAYLEQESAELIWVKESCDITINTTNTQVGVSLQAGLQLAIALVLRITIGDSDQGEAVAQDLIQQFDMTQSNRQKIYIYNTKDATVTTTDTDLAINIQVLLQLLLALIVIVDIL